MSVWSRIRRMLGFKPSVAERVRDMTAQRVRLEQQRHELDQRLDALEAEERNALQQGAAAGSAAEKKQIAGKLVRVRRDLNRVRAQATVFSQQIDILGTHVHHLTLTEQGKRFDLPKAEELTKEAAEAEGVLSELAANADLVAGIEVHAQTPMMAEEEAAILDEFEQVAASKASREAASAGPGGPAKAEPAGREAPPPVPERGKARPELG